MPPSLILPAYRLATYSVRRRPASNPTIQPNAPPAPAPAAAASHVPAATRGANAGMVMVCVEANHARALPSAATRPTQINNPPNPSGGKRALSNSESRRRSQDMNWEQIEGRWHQFTGSARERWGKLTDSDWEVVAGKKDQLLGRIQERYG